MIAAAITDISLTFHAGHTLISPRHFRHADIAAAAADATITLVAIPSIFFICRHFAHFLIVTLIDFTPSFADAICLF